MAIVGAHHTSFTVSELDRSVAFFRDMLGFELLYVREIDAAYFGEIVGHPGAFVRAALFRLPGGAHHLELFQYFRPAGQEHRPRPCDPGSAHLSLFVDNLGEMYAELSAKGISFFSRPVAITAGANRGGLGVYLHDPNGILIELFQPPPTPSVAIR